MSLERINNLLVGTKFVDASIISDTLSSVLTELCQLVSNQSKQILELQDFKVQTSKNIAEMVRKEEYGKTIDDIKYQMKEDSSQRDNQEIEILNKINETKEEFKNDINETVDQVDTKIKDLEENIQNNLDVFQKSFKEMNNRFVISQNNISKFEEEIKVANNSINKIKDLPVSKIVDRVTNIENELKKTIYNVQTVENDMKNFNEKSSKKMRALRDDLNERMDTAEKDIAKMHRIIIDAPTFSVDGNIDINMIISAVNRDTRRIDKFNETIAQIKNKIGSITEKFNTIENSFTSFEYSLAEYIDYEKETNSILSERSLNNKEKNNFLENEVTKLVNKTNLLSKLNCDILSYDSTTLQNIIQILEAFSHQGLEIPNSRGFDDFYVEMKEVNKSLTEIADNFDRVKTNTTAEFKDMPEPFVFNASLLNELSIDDKLEKQRNRKEQNEREFEKKIFLEIEDIRKYVKTHFEDINSINKMYEAKLNNKADFEYTEKMFDRCRTALMKQKEVILQQVQQQEVTRSQIILPSCPKPRIVSTAFGRSKPASVTTRVNQSVPLKKMSSHDALYGSSDKRSIRSSYIAQRK